METIGDLLARDLNQDIEEIIKVDQFDEQTVYAEVKEYVATKNIKDHYRYLLRAIAEAPAEQNEGVGIWISGFFGSGKSSFAKNLGYVLSNPMVMGYSFSDLFKQQLNDPMIGDLVESINKRIPTEVIMFDISKASEVKRGDEKIAEVIYRKLLSYLDYAEDYDIAELEIELEGEGRLEQFMAVSRELNGLDWRRARKGARKINYASAILSRMDQENFPQADSWANSLRGKRPTLTVEIVVERAFELMARRRAGKALFFIIDEVGQYVARSVDRIEDLRAVVEQFGKVGKNRLKARQATAPIWIAVTSQEKLEEVVAALDSKKVQLAKLQDRFKFRVDLAPADIREVASRRVLAKKDEAEPWLRSLFESCQGQLNLACRLERTSRKSEVNESDFVLCYPYLPHFIDISIDIMSGIRLQPGADRHLGGSNRTIIKQAHEMLVNERTRLAEMPVGSLVTIDRIYDLVEGNLSTEKRNDVSQIAARIQDEKGMALRVTKAICLLEFVRDLPRTEANIAACLVDEVGRSSQLADVRDALKILQDSQFVHLSDDGWKLLTPEEREWELQKRRISPKPKDRNDLHRETLGDLFDDPGLKVYRFQKLKSFKLGLSLNGVGIEDGKILISAYASEDAESFPQSVERVRAESRLDAHKNDIYFVFSLNAEIDLLVADLYSSREMVKTYDQRRGQNRINNIEAACLEAEKKELSRKQARLTEKMAEAFKAGSAVFRGILKDGSDLGKTVEGMIKKLLDDIILDLYPRLPVWSKLIKGNEAELILKAANLSGLPAVFYNGGQGLNLVIKDGQKLVPNLEAEPVRDVLDYLSYHQNYGNTDARLGKAIEAHFGGLGYGAELDMIRLILAVLFRAGAIEISFDGKFFDSYQEPTSHDAFANTRTFRATLFTPAKSPPTDELVIAVKNYEELTGETVDVDKSAIAGALKAFAEKELRELLPVEARVKAEGLPVMGQVDAFKESMQRALRGSAYDCVTILRTEGGGIIAAVDRMDRIRRITGDEELARIRQARTASEEMLPVLIERQDLQAQPEMAGWAEELESLLKSEDIYDHLIEMYRISGEVSHAYSEQYSRLHSSRMKEYGAAIEEIKQMPEWAEIEEVMKEQLLKELARRACGDEGISDSGLICSACRSSIPQMESDMAAFQGLKASAQKKIKEAAAPRPGPEAVKAAKVERVVLKRFFAEPLDSKDAVDRAVKRLQEHLMELLRKDVKIELE